MSFPTLYGLAKTGKIKQWSVSVEGSLITVLHGQVGGKLTEQVTPIHEGKNLGKANETTPSQQAKMEAGSKWNKQYDKDYRESVEEIPTSTLPPLAKKYQDESDKLGDEWDTLCKLDGVRCTIFWNNGNPIFQTRGGNAYPTIQAIADELYEKVWQSSPDHVVDCELYRHGMYLEDIVACVKKHNKDTDKIHCHVFDIYDPEKPDMVWEDRYSEYIDLIGLGNNVRVHAVYAIRTYSDEELKKYHELCVQENYEGVICRKLDSKFVFGHRTSDFQKYKIPMDKEFKVVRFDVDKNGCAVPWCRIDTPVSKGNGEFKAPLIGTREYQQRVYLNKDEFIGKYLKVVFEKYSKYGVPTKTKGHVFREVDEDGNATE